MKVNVMLRKYHILTVVLVVFLFVFAVTSSGWCANKKILKMGSIHSVEDLITQSMYKMAELVKQKTNGSVEIQVFPGSQLGDGLSEIEAVSEGSQDIFFEGTTWLAQYVPDATIESIFFLFPSEGDYLKYLESDVKESIYQKFLEKTGIRIIPANGIRSPRVMASKKYIIKKPEDIKNLKKRVPGILGFVKSVEALEVKPVQIPWGEAYLALSQGVADVIGAPMDAMYTMKFYEVTGNIFLTEHVRDAMVVYINDKLFNSFNKKEQEAIIAASKETGKWYTEQVKKQVEEFKVKMAKEGVKFYDVDKKAFAVAMEPGILKMEEKGLWSPGLYQKIKDILSNE